jgi:glutathione S-transferase
MIDPADPITIYRLEGCPFCERVIQHLHQLELAYESEYVAPLHSHRDAVKRLTGVRSVPAIDDPNTGVAMAESANIIAYLDATYGGD